MSGGGSGCGSCGSALNVTSSMQPPLWLGIVKALSRIAAVRRGQTDLRPSSPTGPSGRASTNMSAGRGGRHPNLLPPYGPAPTCSPEPRLGVSIVPGGAPVRQRKRLRQMGIRHVEREELRRLEAKTLDARFRAILENGLNSSPFEAEAVVAAVKEVYFPFLQPSESGGNALRVSSRVSHGLRHGLLSYALTGCPRVCRVIQDAAFPPTHHPSCYDFLVSEATEPAVRCGWARDPLMVALSRRRVGRAGARRPSLVRVPDPRRRAGRA